MNVERGRGHRGPGVRRPNDVRRRGVMGIVALVVLAGCADRPGDSAPAQPRTGGRVVIALDADPGTLNPVRMTTAQAARVFSLLQPSLVRFDPASGTWAPALARSWTVSDSGRVVELNLDPGLRWSDGEVFTAADVVASFELYRDPVVAYPRRERLAPILTLEAPDPGRVRVVFAERVADPLGLLTHDVLPAHLIATFDREDPARWSIGRAPVTLGAYRLARWQQDDSLLLERNPHHRGPAGRLDAIEIVVVPDAAARLVRLRAGEVDIVASVPATHAADLRGDAGLTVVPVQGRSVAFLQFAMHDPRLADLRVRRAIDLAIDRRAIVAGALYGFAEPAATFLPPVSWAHDAMLVPTERDLDTARALLDEAGFLADRDGPRHRGEDVLRLRLLSVAGDPVREAIAVQLRSQLGEVGIEVEPRAMDLGSALRVMQSGEFEIFFAQVSGPVDADLRPFFGTDGRFNFGRYASAEFDALADAAANAPDRARARAAAVRMQARLDADLPASHLYYPATVVVHRSRLRGVAANWISPFEGFETWWVEDGDQP